MGVEICAGGIVYKMVEGVPLFLLIQGKTSKWWVFPKGHIEKGESILQTAHREVFEETGLGDIEQMPGFFETISFINNKGNHKHVHHYLFETKRGDVKISKEHLDFKWLAFEEAFNLVDHENQKRILRVAQEVIKNE